MINGDIRTEYVLFSERKDRSFFAAKRFEKYLKGKVLDAGCFEAPMREILKEADYTGIDIAGIPDIKINLEKIKKLPFKDKSFNAVLCIDVLEHLDNLHCIFAELLRVSAKYVIISLPNCWRDARLPLSRGKGRIGHYGLPPAAPIDRHKWFFSAEEAVSFIEYKRNEFDLNQEELFLTSKPSNFFIRSLRKLIYPGKRYKNRYTSTVWAVLSKGDEID